MRTDTARTSAIPGRSTRTGLRCWSQELQKLTLRIVGLGLTFAALVDPVMAHETIPVEPNDKIIFFGDSITQGGEYTDLVHAWLLASRPHDRFTVLNRGISSQTLSGLSEADHDPPRECALDRFARDVVAERPNILISAFGMNDGIYHPFSWERFEAFQTGVHQLIQRGHDIAGARGILLVTPPPFDPYRAKASDPKAKAYGYKFQYLEYDTVLSQYSSWEESLGFRTWPEDRRLAVADVHTRLGDFLNRRRLENVSYSFSGDAVHPDSTGHWLMAVEIARALEIPEQHSDVELTPVAGMPGSLLAESREQVSHATGTIDAAGRLLLASDGEFHSKKVRFIFGENFPEETTRYEVLASDVSLGIYTADELAEGIELGESAEFLPAKNGRRLLDLIRTRRQREYQHWRATVVGSAKQPAKPLPDADEAIYKTDLQKANAEIESIRQPVPVKWFLKPAS